jgi:hypothetical protein
MKFINIFCVLILLFFNCCKLPTVGYFITQPFIKAYETKFDNNMTIVFDETISDTLIIKSPGIKKMTILSFRHSIEDALKNTFKNSCIGLSDTAGNGEIVCCDQLKSLAVAKIALRCFIFNQIIQLP